MEFEGRVQRVLPVESGTSQRGEWKTMPFVFEYFENENQRYSDKVLLKTFDTNIMAQIGAYLKKGPDGKAVMENGEYVLAAELKCRVGFGHSVKSFDKSDGTRANVNDVRLYKFEVVNGTAAVPQYTKQGQQQGQYQGQQGQQQVVPPFPPAFPPVPPEAGDGLPF